MMTKEIAVGHLSRLIELASVSLVAASKEPGVAPTKFGAIVILPADVEALSFLLAEVGAEAERARLWRAVTIAHGLLEIQKHNAPAREVPTPADKAFEVLTAALLGNQS